MLQQRNSIFTPGTHTTTSYAWHNPVEEPTNKVLLELEYSGINTAKFHKRLAKLIKLIETQDWDVNGAKTTSN